MNVRSLCVMWVLLTAPAALSQASFQISIPCAAAKNGESSSSMGTT